MNKLIILSCVALALLTGCVGGSSNPIKDHDIKRIGNSQLQVEFASWNSYAITKIFWKGVQIIDDKDSGRQCQTAIAYNGRGEEINPTQAGGAHYVYGYNPTSEGSVSLGATVVSPTVFASSTQMAYWKPYNGIKLSPDVVDNRVTVGFGGDPQVIQYLVTIKSAEADKYTAIQYEPLTCYMLDGAGFNSFYRLVGGGLVADTPASLENIHEKPTPPIVAKADGSIALGIWVKGIPQPAHPTRGYGNWNIGGSSKINSAFVETPVPPVKAFEGYIVVGTLKEVEVKMKQLME